MQTKFVPTYQMPSEYDRQAAEARRRQAMAEALEAQAYRPLSGSDAPTPAAAPLVMALQSFLSAGQRKKAMEKATKAEETESEYGRRMLGRLQGGYAYQPDKELEQQMAKKPEETLMQYNERMQATPFTAKAAAVPEQTELSEVTRQSQYRKSPDEVFGMAMTPVGTAALKRAPMLAAALERSMTPAEMEEFYAPTATADGNLVQFGKRGGRKETGFKAPADSEKMPSSVQEYNFAVTQGYKGTFEDWQKSNKAAGATKITLDKGGELAQELFLKDLATQNQSVRGAESILNKLDSMEQMTKEGTYTGSLAPGAVGASQFLQSFGINVDPSIVANTRSFEAASNQLVLDFMAANGGARGFTQEETKILQNAFPKIIDSPQARQQITSLLRNRAKETIGNYNQMLDQYTKTYPSSVIPFRKVETAEDRYQRWKQQQGGG